MFGASPRENMEDVDLSTPRNEQNINEVSSQMSTASSKLIGVQFRKTIIDESDDDSDDDSLYLDNL